MFWADRIADEILAAHPDQEEFIVRDEKTLSGRVHVGSLRGVVIHGLIAQVLNEKGKKAKFIFEFNDFDPMDGLPIYLDETKFAPEMGKPLKNVPSPDANHKNYAEYFGDEFLGVIQELGFDPEIPRASGLYESGQVNNWIQLALEKKDDIREIYREVSGSQKSPHWSPVQVICENCGRVGTTDVKDFDGKEVTYTCEKHKVKWAEGCGHEGKVSPFDGNAKLLWKVEWPAKWAAYKVDVEGSGKDHNASGGSHEIGEHICEKVFNTTVPFNIPYEFFLIGGKKMSSSKGSGATAREVADTLPPELLRFLMIRTEPRKPIEFNPEGETIPRLFDEHDRAANEYFLGEKSTFPDLGRCFFLSQIDLNKKPVEKYLPRFSKLVFAIQIPRLDIQKEVAEWKGSPLTKDDLEELELRIKYAKRWIEDFAPENYLFKISDEIPERADELTDAQKDVLKKMAEQLARVEWEGENIHGALHGIKEESGLSPREFFATIYLPILGRDSGPQAGWLISALEKEWVLKRFEEVSKKSKKSILSSLEELAGKTKDEKIFHIAPAFFEKFPEAKLAIITVKKTDNSTKNPDIEKFLRETEKAFSLEGEIPTHPRIECWREAYRSFGMKPSEFRSSIEGLVRRVKANKPLPLINPLVDIYNAISIKHLLPAGGEDLDKIEGALQLNFAEGTEEFFSIGSEKNEPPKKGELVYQDDKNIVCRSWNWREADRTKLTPKTTEAVLILEALPPTKTSELESAAKELEEKINKFLGGEIKIEILSNQKNHCYL